MKKVLILGVNGFIGHHLSKRILETTDWHVYGMDMQSDRITELLAHPQMHFFEGQAILVQVIKDPIGTKGARLSTQVSIAGRLLVFLPQDDHVGVSQKIPPAARRRS